MKSLHIRTADRIVYAVPARLDSITTYVLLEQETWFEKELIFLRHWLKPGMTAIEIGANVGIYALAMARWVGPKGRVFAYEPGGEARAMLKESRGINKAANLKILDFALSDREREGHLVWGNSSELNALGVGGPGETVRITSLDIENARHGWRSPDFLKIDAEGEEERILAGGHEFFSVHSPLVMFEVQVGTAFNKNLLTAFVEMGFGLFRLLPGAPILVAWNFDEPLDRFELNLFAAKPDRAGSMKDAGFLVEQPLDWRPDNEALASTFAMLRKEKFANAFGSAFDDFTKIDPDYAQALAAIGTWRAHNLSATQRYTALCVARQTLGRLGLRAPTVERYATFARLAWEGGWRGESLTALVQLAEYVSRNLFSPVEPFWPPCPRFDNVPVGDVPTRWFGSAVAEQLERAWSHSTYFGASSPGFDWLCEQPNASPEMHRRKILREARAGRNPIVPARLRNKERDNLNADVWRSGRVPGTRVV
jgi:FkbM family methyltransferase